MNVIIFSPSWRITKTYNMYSEIFLNFTNFKKILENR